MGFISPEKLAPKNQNILQNNEVFISQISLFEIAIKQKIGKLPELPLSIDTLTVQMQQDNFNLLPFSNAHLAAYDAIPLLEHHRDPFDRMLPLGRAALKLRHRRKFFTAK